MALAGALGRLRLTDAMLWAERKGPPRLRAVNYHDVPRELAGAFETHLQYFTERYQPVGGGELTAFLAGRATLERPGLLLTFDDGLRSHHDVVAPLLEKYGLTGWFFVPTGFVDCSPTDQGEFARANRISRLGQAYRDGREALSWREARALAQRHEVGCHTWSHRRLVAELSERDLRREINEAKARIESELQSECDSFAWVGGEEWSYGGAAARAVSQAGFTFSFMTNHAPIRECSDPLALQRSHLEATHSLGLVRFQMSWVMDAVYARKRARVAAVTTVS